MERKKRKKINMTIVSAQHYFRLAYRSALLIALLVVYIRDKLAGGGSLMRLLDDYPVFFSVLWIVFTVEMLQRFFPMRTESPGSQKQFACNYMKSGDTNIEIQENNSTMLVAMIWVVFNLVFGALYMSGVIDEGVMILLCSAFSVCDVVCILFFCPFQAWFMKNKCCCTCRIYNWDYAMMFTPLFFIRGLYTWSLLALSIILLIRWEITFFRHPERFAETTNDFLKCENCSERLCAHKKHLRKFRRQLLQYTEARLQFLRKEEHPKNAEKGTVK